MCLVRGGKTWYWTAGLRSGVWGERVSFAEIKSSSQIHKPSTRMRVDWEFGCHRSGYSRETCWTLLRLFHDSKCQQCSRELKLRVRETEGAETQRLSTRECQHSLVFVSLQILTCAEVHGLSMVRLVKQWLVFLFILCLFSWWLIFEAFLIRRNGFEFRSVLNSHCNPCLQIHFRAKHWSCGWCFPQPAPV